MNDPPGDDAQSELNPNGDAFASAVAVALGAGPAEQSTLVSLLTTLAAEFDSRYADHIATFNADPANSFFPGAPPSWVCEPLRPALNFLSAVALSRYYSKVQADAGTPVQVPGFPAAPAAGTTLPPVTIPADVVAGGFGSSTAQQVIPLGALPPLPNPLQGDIDLFGPGVPHKPANAPPPTTTVRWLWTGVFSHSGLFGSSGFHTINSGRTLTGRGATILGVVLQLVGRNSAPLGDLTTTTRLGRPDAVVGSWPSTAGARIVGDASGSSDETVTVYWWFDFGRACRYRIGYLVQGAGATL